MTFKTVLPIITVISFLALGGCPVYAQTSTTRPAVQPLRETTASKAAEAREKAASKAADMREKAASKTATLQANVASRAASLREKLANFKDKKKATLIEKINTSLTNINQRRTSQMLNHVDTLTKVLTKAEARANAAQSGTDVSAAMTDAVKELGLSKTALANAKTAVDQQSKKKYEIPIASESGAKMAVQETRDMMHQDLMATHNLVKEARRVLINAIIKLGQSLGEQVSTSGGKESTSSATN